MSPFTTSRRGTRIVTFWLVVMVVILIDQATKAAVRQVSPELGRMGTLIPGVLDLVHVENTGAAFSIGMGAGPLFVILALLVAFVACCYVVANDIPLPLTVSLACVVGGGLGNMMDRLLRGSVTDFLATSFIDFPVFNVADIAVTCGVAVACFCFLTLGKEEEDPEEGLQ